MKKAKIKRIVSVEPTGIVGVELYGMRNDLSLLFINIEDVNWFGVDEDGKSQAFVLKEDVEIYYREIFTRTRFIAGVSFTNNKQEYADR